MTVYTQWKFTILLGAMLVLVLLRTAASDMVGVQPVIDVASAVVVLMAVLSARDDRRFRQAAVILASPVIVLMVFVHCVPTHIAGPTYLALRAASALFLVFTIGTILSALLKQTKVTHDTLAGALAGYLLIGSTWTEFYAWLVLINPSALRGLSSTTSLWHDGEGPWHELQYFSYCTLTTLGFGDIAPISPAARTLAMLEAITGQLYLAIIVAGLISLRISQATQPAENQGPIPPA